jgi:predicted ATP-grasp superfamily ATP-dependent carboligase
VPDRLAALVLDGGSRTALVAIRCLARAGRPVGLLDMAGDAPSMCAASRYLSLRSVVPTPDEDEDGYVAHLLELLDRHPADVLMPVGDRTLTLLRKHRDALASRTSLAIAPEPGLEAAIDKRGTLDAARELGIAVPRGVLVTTEEELDAAAAVGFPCVIKPTLSWGAESARAGRLACFTAVDVRELQAAVRTILAGGAEALVQEWLPGRREAVHLLYAKDEFWAAVCVAAERTNPPLGGDSVMRMTIPPAPDIVEAAKSLVRRIGLEGYAEVEFRRDAHGRPVLMEINPRLSASVETAVRAGVNIPVMLHDWARGAPLQRAEGYRIGVRLRWVGGDARWLRETFRNQGRPDIPPVRQAVGAFLADTVRPSAYDIFDLRDPRPAVRKSANFVRNRRRQSGAAPGTLDSGRPVRQ